MAFKEDGRVKKGLNAIMALCETDILSAARSIEPTQAQKSGAKRSHDFLRSQLSIGTFGKRIQSSYLSGSYARDTAIAPLDDVDVIFVIDPSHWKSEFLSSRPNPEVLLKSFANAVRYRYGASSVRRQRRSVCLQLNHISIDIVPAIPLDSQGSKILIPDRNKGLWLETNPKAHAEFSSRVNQLRGKKIKPLIKLLKFWNCSLPSTSRLKSFAIETIVARLYEHEELESLQMGLLRFFDFVLFIGGKNSQLQWKSRHNMSLGLFPSIMDASGLSNLTSDFDENRRERFMACAARSRDLMIKSYAVSRDSTAWSRTAAALKMPI